MTYLNSMLLWACILLAVNGKTQSLSTPQDLALIVTPVNSDSSLIQLELLHNPNAVFCEIVAHTTDDVLISSEIIDFQQLPELSERPFQIDGSVLRIDMGTHSKDERLKLSVVFEDSEGGSSNVAFIIQED